MGRACLPDHNVNIFEMHLMHFVATFLNRALELFKKKDSIWKGRSKKYEKNSEKKWISFPKRGTWHRVAYIKYLFNVCRLIY